MFHQTGLSMKRLKENIFPTNKMTDNSKFSAKKYCRTVQNFHFYDGHILMSV